MSVNNLWKNIKRNTVNICILYLYTYTDTSKEKRLKSDLYLFVSSARNISAAPFEKTDNSNKIILQILNNFIMCERIQFHFCIH